MELTLDSVLSPGGMVGNLSYALLIASMAMRDIFWLRVLAILSGLAGITYDVVWLQNPVGVFWESCFTVVNVFQWAWLVYERKRSTLSVDQAELKGRVFPNLSDQDFRKLIDWAEVRDYGAGDTLVEKGDQVRELHLLLTGEAAVLVGDKQISSCVSGDFIGEIGFFSEVPATATVAALTEIRCLVFDCRRLRRKMNTIPELERGVTFALNSNLASKLVRRHETVAMV